MTGFLRGVATALVTPFGENGVDFPLLGELIERQIGGGTDALVILGTTGEPATMSEKERTETVLFAKKTVRGRAKLIVGAGSNDTARAVSESKRAEELGADAVLCVTPYYNKCTQRGLYEYYARILGAVKIPVIAYNVPPRTGVNLLPETAARLAEIRNFAGIKEASGNMAQIMETARRIRGKCDLYSGDDALNLPILAAGGTAVVSVVSNLLPADVKALVTAALFGKREEAIALADKLLPVVKACFSEVNPIPVKAGLELLGYPVGAPRSPLTRCEEEHTALLADALREYGMKVKR